MLITSLAALMMMAATPPRRAGDCVAMPILMAWHENASRRDQRPRDIRVDQGWRPRPRCFRLSAR